MTGTSRLVLRSIRTLTRSGLIRSTCTPPGARIISGVSGMYCSPGEARPRSMRAERRSSVIIPRSGSVARRRMATPSTTRPDSSRPRDRPTYSRGTAKSLTRSSSLRTTYQQTKASIREKILRYRFWRRLKRMVLVRPSPRLLRGVRSLGGGDGLVPVRPAAAQVAAQERLERSGIERARQPPFDGAADRAALLRDHDHHAVVLLRQADRRAVPRAVLARQLRIGRHRQEAGRRLHATLADDDRPVVHRRAGREDVHQQVVGDRGIELDPGVDLIRQRLLALDDDQTPGGAGRQRRGGMHDLVQHPLGQLVVAETQER